MKIFLGVDGGQSGTVAAIGDETGRVLGEGEAGPSNHAAGAEGRAKLERALRESLSQAAAQAGLDAAALEFESACFGMSGGPEGKHAILSALVRAARLRVTTDAAVALAGATASGLGVVIIAGTGSMALGRNAEGRNARAGGWGYVFGDEGSAFDVVRHAARAARWTLQGCFSECWRMLRCRARRLIPSRRLSRARLKIAASRRGRPLLKRSSARSVG